MPFIVGQIMQKLNSLLLGGTRPLNWEPLPSAVSILRQNPTYGVGLNERCGGQQAQMAHLLSGRQGLMVTNRLLGYTAWLVRNTKKIQLIRAHTLIC